MLSYIGGSFLRSAGPIPTSDIHPAGRFGRLRPPKVLDLLEMEVALDKVYLTTYGIVLMSYNVKG